MILAFKICVILICLSVFVSSFEQLMLGKFRLDIIYQTSKLDFKKSKTVLWVLYFQLVVSVLVFISILIQLKQLSILLVWILFLLNLYQYTLKYVSKDGADQLRLIVLGILSISLLTNEKYSFLYSIIFISIQTIISYTTSGFVKLSSSYWRRGDALGKILNNYSYGNRFGARMLLENPKLNMILTYSPILAMISLPISFCFENQIILYLILTSLFFFHLGTAVLMGLNDFLYTFPATYPCLIYFHYYIYN